MAKTLSTFMAQNVSKIKVELYVATKRIQEDGKPVDWEIGCITGEQDTKLRTECTRQVQVGKRQYREHFDVNEYLVKLAAASTRFPDLSNAELQNSYGVATPERLLSIMLTPGELTEYEAKVQEVNGFDVPLSEKVDEAKN